MVLRLTAGQPSPLSAEENLNSQGDSHSGLPMGPGARVATLSLQGQGTRARLTCTLHSTPLRSAALPFSPVPPHHSTSTSQRSPEAKFKCHPSRKVLLSQKTTDFPIGTETLPSAPHRHPVNAECGWRGKVRLVGAHTGRRGQPWAWGKGVKRITALGGWQSVSRGGPCAEGSPGLAR